MFGVFDDVELSNVDFQLFLSLVSAHPSSDTIDISAIIPLSVKTNDNIKIFSFCGQLITQYLFSFKN